MRDLYLYRYLIVLLVLSLISACGQAFLDLKPNQREMVPSRLEDYLAIMNNTGFLNEASCHALVFFGTDEYHMSDAMFATFPLTIEYNYQKNAYLWNDQIYEGGESLRIDWHIGYQNIHWSNVVLEGLSTLDRSEDPNLHDRIKGMALFNRAINYYNLAQLYCPEYTASDANESLGLPIRLDSDPTYSVPRSNLTATYEQILHDLQQAVQLVALDDPNQYSVDQLAIYALFSRIYLNMEDYENAEKYADLALSINRSLWDFNGLEFNQNYSFPLYGFGNPEVIYMSRLGQFPQFTSMHVDSGLLDLYEPGDLRLQAFFSTEIDGHRIFKGSYNGDHYYFTGITTSEVYLIASESKIRLGKIDEGVSLMNALRKHRFAPVEYVPYELVSAEEALYLVVDERRREMVLRGQRWSDLRRLNKDPRFQTTLSRVVLGKTFLLPPQDNRWTWPIPLEAITIGKLVQNPR